MNIAITIGSYRLPEFLRLNLYQLQETFPDAPFLISDDHSDKSNEIAEIAKDRAAFVTSGTTRGHFAGLWQSLCNSLSFAEQEKCDIALYLSQRVIPVLPIFSDFVAKPFEEKAINIIVPGRTSAAQIRGPSTQSFGGYGILVDAIAFRVGTIIAKQLLDHYTGQYKFGRFGVGIVPTIALSQLLSTHFKSSTYVSYDLANEKTSADPAFLRHETSDSATFKELAKKHGLEGEFDCRSLAEIFKNKGYVARPSLVV